MSTFLQTSKMLSHAATNYDMLEKSCGMVFKKKSKSFFFDSHFGRLLYHRKQYIFLVKKTEVFAN